MKAYKGFLPKFYIDEEQGIIRGKTLNTRDTITFYGKTVDEALQAFRDSVDEYLEFCKEIGVEPEKPYCGKLPSSNPGTARRLNKQTSNIQVAPQEK